MLIRYFVKPLALRVNMAMNKEEKAMFDKLMAQNEALLGKVGELESKASETPTTKVSNDKLATPKEIYKTSSYKILGNRELTPDEKVALKLATKKENYKFVYDTLASTCSIEKFCYVEVGGETKTYYRLQKGYMKKLVA